MRIQILRKCRIVFFIPLMVLNTALLPPQDVSPEYKIKAVFLYNFTQFVEWPENAFPESGTSLVIGILGNDPFGYYLDETVKGEKVNNHPLIVKRFRKVEEIGTCHVLFINIAGKNELGDIFESLKSQPILTVGDDTNFTKEGGMVRFFNVKNKTRIQINLDAAKDAELIISSKLLGLAEIVNSSTN